MQYRRRTWNVGTWAVAVAIVAGLATFNALPASAEDTTSTGNRVFFRGAPPDLPVIVPAS
ncbi:MAG: hypothetical protein NDI90_22480 [Nitrospira sp. BO4]|jgi:hypothetical protein|nr:hypothetical protein [Nitrospira sp. BO4]